MVLVYDPGMDKEICLACLDSVNHAWDFSFEPCIYMHLIANDELEFLAVDYIFVVSLYLCKLKEENVTRLFLYPVIAVRY